MKIRRWIEASLCCLHRLLLALDQPASMAKIINISYPYQFAILQVHLPHLVVGLHAWCLRYPGFGRKQALNLKVRLIAHSPQIDLHHLLKFQPVQLDLLVSLLQVLLRLIKLDLHRHQFLLILVLYVLSLLVLGLLRPHQYQVRSLQLIIPTTWLIFLYNLPLYLHQWGILLLLRCHSLKSCLVFATQFLHLDHPFLGLNRALLLPLDPLIKRNDLLSRHPQLFHQVAYLVRVLVLIRDPMQRLPLIVLNPLDTPHLLPERRDNRLTLLQLVLQLNLPLKLLFMLQLQPQCLVVFLQSLHQCPEHRNLPPRAPSLGGWCLN